MRYRNIMTDSDTDTLETPFCNYVPTQARYATLLYRTPAYNTCTWKFPTFVISLWWHNDTETITLFQKCCTYLLTCWQDIQHATRHHRSSR